MRIIQLSSCKKCTPAENLKHCSSCGECLPEFFKVISYQKEDWGICSRAKCEVDFYRTRDYMNKSHEQNCWRQI